MRAGNRSSNSVRRKPVRHLVNRDPLLLRCDQLGNEIVARWCPAAWEAFLDYELNAVRLSRIEAKVVALINQGLHDDALSELQRNGLLERGPAGLARSRERNELEAKLRSFALPIPWASSGSAEGSEPK